MFLDIYFFEYPKRNEAAMNANARTCHVFCLVKVIPMLPRLLCEELCSLNPLTDRLTFSVIWTITPQGKVRPLKQVDGWS